MICSECGYIAEHRDALLWHHGQLHYHPPTELALELRRMIEQPSRYGPAPPRPAREEERIGELVVELVVLVINAPGVRRGRRVA